MNENRPERPYLQFQNQMSRLETVLLLLYLPIHAFLMPTILGFLFQRAGISYSMMQLNVCYYAITTVNKTPHSRSQSTSKLLRRNRRATRNTITVLSA